MKPLYTPPHNTRIGFHYYPDTLHYRESDLRAWLPELRQLGASWLVLPASVERAIPETFLNGVISGGIEPVLHFHLPLPITPPAESLSLILQTYARWGLHYVALFDRPNRRRAWSARDWAQNELVERFVDLFLPLADVTLQAGLIPIFPPLEPGGDYWDTAFLRSALQSIQRRGHNELLRRMVLGAYGWPGNRPLDWGAGGPERWPGARPYYTPEGEQDQRGFYIFDWYLTIARAVLGFSPAVLLLGTGCHLDDRIDPHHPAVDPSSHATRNLTLVHLLTRNQGLEESGDTGGFERVPDEVLGGAFWLLTASAESPYTHHAWFKPDGETLPVVGALRQWSARQHSGARPEPSQESALPGGDDPHPIANYLLLPTYEWGVADWHLEVIRPFIKRHRPTVGFSIDEAILARHVTVVGGIQAFPEEVLDELRAAGCSVERIHGDGTSIASQLASL